MEVAGYRTPSRSHRIVLVDSREERRQLMVNVVEAYADRASVVAQAGSRDSALLLVHEYQADGVVMDVRMPVGEGLATIAELRRRVPRLAIIVCSFDLDRATATKVLDHGANACLAKPVSPWELLAALDGARPATQLDREPQVDVLAAASR
jgi:DNA-binding NarL/FixJ family response regulator